MPTHDVRDTIERWAAGVRARDIDVVLSRHSPELLMFDVVGPVRLHGAGRVPQSVGRTVLPLARRDGRFELVEFTLRLTIGLEKRDGEWIVVHEHHSQPLDFDAVRVGSASA
jgi:ketosteroid isomerase-like protein